MAERRSQRGLLDPESEAVAEAYAALPAVRRQTRGLLSLEPQQDQSMAQTALEAVLGFIPGVGQALAARDIERARRADDPAAAAMAATEFLPLGRLAGMMRRPGPIMSELDVYHGTPHKFPATEANPLGEFDASKIGTGEGAQAYGHGIYFAENPQVAGMYRSARWQDDELVKALKTPTLTKDEYSTLGELTRKSRSRTEKLTEAEQSALERLQSQQRRQAEELSAARESTSTLYKADLPDEMIDRMLDWDKPLSEQPALVKQLEAGGFLKKAPAPFSNRYTGPTGTLIDLDSPGGNLVMGGGWNQKTSAALRDAGIPGIKYKDAGSRGQGGSGTRNFVVFPGEEKKVKILERK